MTPAVQPSLLKVQPLAETSRRTMLITNVRLPGYNGLKRLWISPEGEVQAIEAMDQSFERIPPEDLAVVNLEKDWLSLGGIDLQINGAQGVAFPELCLENADRLPEICQFLWEQGIDAFLPTLVTCSIEQLHQALQVLQNYCKRPSEANAAKILGVHLEGPCLNPQKRGAHPEEHLQPLTLETMEQVLGDYGDLVKMVTLAPELDPSGVVIRALIQRGIIVSLGHSQATAAEAVRAFNQGATLVTHAFNAMPGLHHREPGLLGAALLQPGVRCGFIADGQHISPMMLRLLLQMGRDHLFLVSDALAPLGLPDGTYPWDSREIQVDQGTARLADGTISGTTLPLLSGVCNLVKWDLCSVEEAIALATTTPRQALGWEPGGEDDEIPSSLLRDRLYLGRSIHQFLRWTIDPNSHELTWKRLGR